MDYVADFLHLEFEGKQAFAIAKKSHPRTHR